MRKQIIMAALAAALCAGVAAGPALASPEGIKAVKDFLVEHGERMLVESKSMSGAAQKYYDIIKGARFDYARAAKDHGPALAALIKTMKTGWIKSHDNYENVEGIVAGIPSLSVYDLIIDAGKPAPKRQMWLLST